MMNVRTNDETEHNVWQGRNIAPYEQGFVQVGN
jgi:hypothetical protein